MIKGLRCGMVAATMALAACAGWEEKEFHLSPGFDDMDVKIGFFDSARRGQTDAEFSFVLMGGSYGLRDHP